MLFVYPNYILHFGPINSKIINLTLPKSETVKQQKDLANLFSTQFVRSSPEYIWDIIKDGKDME